MAQNPIEDLLVRAYPNPQRVGCPGKDALLRLASEGEPLESDLSQHVWHCSPCFQEFKELRDGVRLGERRTLVKKFGVASMVCATLVLLVYLPVHIRQSWSGSFDLAKLDFSKELSERGINGDDFKQEVIAPTAKCCLLLLPPGNESGDYEVQIRSGSDITKTVKSFIGVGKEQSGHPTRVECKVGFLSLAPQSYVAAWRLRGSEVWHYGMFEVQ